MSDQQKAKPNGIARWNPFQRLDTAEDALAAARCGTWVAGYLALSYLVQSVLLATAGKDTFGNGGSSALLFDLVLILVAAFFAWRIHTRQVLWAQIVVALWFAVELLVKAAAIAAGQQKTNAGWILMLLALSAGAVLGVRGSWKLRKLKLGGEPAPAAE